MGSPGRVSMAWPSMWKQGPSFPQLFRIGGPIWTSDWLAPSPLPTLSDYSTSTARTGSVANSFQDNSAHCPKNPTAEKKFGLISWKHFDIIWSKWDHIKKISVPQSVIIWSKGQSLSPFCPFLEISGKFGRGFVRPLTFLLGPCWVIKGPSFRPEGNTVHREAVLPNFSRIFGQLQ